MYKCKEVNKRKSEVTTTKDTFIKPQLRIEQCLIHCLKMHTFDAHILIFSLKTEPRTSTLLKSRFDDKNFLFSFCRQQ